MYMVVVNLAGLVEDAVAGLVSQLSTKRAHSASENSTPFSACNCVRTLASNAGIVFSSVECS